MNKKITGLTLEEVISSRKKYGSNSLEKEKGKSFFGKFLENLSDPIIKVLLFAVLLEIAVTLGRCNWFEVGGIIVAVVIATVVSTLSEYGSERAFEKMQEESDNARARVFRAGELIDISISDIVVGDVIFASSGEMIAADGEIIKGKLSVDQSALNGESCEVLKFPEKSKDENGLNSKRKVFRGSVVRDGEGIIRVNKVGRETYYGMVAKDIQAQTRESPLKLRLGRLAAQISKIGYFMAALVGLVYLFFAFVVDNGFDGEKIIFSIKNIPYLISNLSHALTLMITVVVVAVPEGLPMMITVVLSANMKKMLNDNIMVKKLVGIETAGSMNILFTDKTGTLTTGKTSVERVITSDGVYKHINSLKAAKSTYKYLKISAIEGALESSGKFSGNSTDKALVSFFESEKSDDDFEPRVVSKVPFSSDKKYSSVTLENGEVIIKGAPELIIEACNFELRDNGETRKINSSALIKKYEEAAKCGERVIGLCVKNDNAEFVFVALIVLKDKVRAGVKSAVDKMLSAGVQVVMLTGDGKDTATAIAEECGIIKSRNPKSVITRDQLENMSDDEIKKILPFLRVVARALPRDKSRLVRISQEMGLVVGMTGDGINDAPSLKLADVGFAMGSGTDIAKGASDIVILDNSLLAITKTVLYGRTIFKSIRKFISFQLMMNLTACGVSLIGQFLGIENPITIIQMLWINIIMDTLGGLAFAGEPALDYYMMEKPKSREEKILSRDMLHQIAFTGGYTLFVCVIFLKFNFFSSLFRYDSNNLYFLTGFYALFVFMGIFNCFNSRSERLSLLSNISKNGMFLAIMAFIIVIQIVMIYFGGEIFRSVPLTFRELLNVILIASSVVPFDMVRRVIKKLSK